MAYPLLVFARSLTRSLACSKAKHTKNTVNNQLNYIDSLYAGAFHLILLIFEPKFIGIVWQIEMKCMKSMQFRSIDSKNEFFEKFEIDKLIIAGFLSTNRPFFWISNQSIRFERFNHAIKPKINI